MLFRSSQEESKNRVIASDIDLAAKQVSDRKAYTIIKAEENKQLELQIANEIASTAALISSTALRAASANVHGNCY